MKIYRLFRFAVLRGLQVCFVLLAFNVWSEQQQNQEQMLCSSVRVLKEIKPKWTTAEIKWLCGDPDNYAYSQIPHYQAEFHARAFLQQRAYLNPSFEYSEGVLTIDPGVSQRIENFEVYFQSPSDTWSLLGNTDWDVLSNAEPEISEKNIQKALRSIVLSFREERLNPRTLNALEGRLARWLQEQAYPCPKIESEVYPNGRLILRIETGKNRNLGRLDIENIEGLTPAAYLRFQPFYEDTAYNPFLLELYEKRLLRQEIVQGTYFRDLCVAPKDLKEGEEFRLDEARLHQSFLLGPPRTLRFGLGFTTEAGPLLQAQWSHHRYGVMASPVNVSLNLSYREQGLASRADLFLWPEWPRFSSPVDWKLRRQKAPDYTEIYHELGWGARRIWDGDQALWTLGAGPYLSTSWYSQKEDLGFLRKSSMALGFYFERKSHSYEFYDVHPQSGSRWNISWNHRDKFLGAEQRSDNVNVSYRDLTSLGICGNGRCILAVRGQLQKLWLEDANLIGSLPPSLKVYLGGYDSLRGFESQSLPDNAGLGALMGANFGIELRGNDLIVPSFEPFIFWDAGLIEGISGLDENEFYNALGLGLRWFSPIGLVQGYLALPRPGKFYFYAALGGEF